MKAHNTTQQSQTSFIKSALSAVLALSFMSAPSFASSDTAEALQFVEEAVVKGTEYQPNIVQENGSHLKVKKQLNGAKQVASTSAKVAGLILPNQSPLSREAARNSDDPDFWIYDSYVTLTSDIDYDGYHSSFKLEFDVDTIYQSAPIYAVIYTSTSDVFTPFYTTDIYNINGDNTRDAIIVENDLVSGFPSNDYEIMIAIFDADTDQMVAVSDGTDDADLAFVSLESQNYEYVEQVEVVVVEHGGSIGTWFLASLGLIAFRRYKA